MPRIQVLDKRIAELIAAGEVVERPSSVIKELVENAIDAGASVVTVEIRHGGITYMRVTDNGCGIAPEDVPTAFLRHATSKIVQQDDLNSIMTLGFRGEALASISAVSHVELLTRARGASIGVRYTCGGDEQPVLEDAGCPEGTTIVIRDLFYNTPARMKFLKKDSTEGNSVAGVLDKMALSHPEISFRFIRDGKEQLRTPGDNQLSSAIYGVYGKEFLSTLIPVDYEYKHVKVTGFVSKPSGSRPNRSMQNFFINGRYIRSRTAMAALEEAYKGSIMAGKFPACALHLQLSFSAVDVNVHPAKLEVRFVNERPIFDSVYHAVKSALHQGDTPKALEFKKAPIQPYAPLPRKQEQLKLDAKPQHPAPRPSPVQFDSVLRDVEWDTDFHSYADRVVEAPKTEQPKTQVPKPEAPAPQEARPLQPPVEENPHPIGEQPTAAAFQEEIHSKIIGEAFGTYLIVEYGKDSLMFIDKHAAHERLLYEKLKSSHQEAAAQTLLAPVPVSLEKDEYTALLSKTDMLSSAGFEVEDFGAGTVLVRAVPMLLGDEDAASAIMEIAGYFASSKQTTITEHLDWVYHNVACRAAIKAGDVTHRDELVALASLLEQNPDIRYCPHGRPVYILLKRRDLERQFGRT